MQGTWQNLIFFRNLITDNWAIIIKAVRLVQEHQEESRDQGPTTSGASDASSDEDEEH